MRLRRPRSFKPRIPYALQPFRLFRHDFKSLRSRWVGDWLDPFSKDIQPSRIHAIQQIIASAVYMFFTNILPGITFASDLYVLTGKSWGSIEIVFSTGICSIIFALASAQPLCILGVTGTFTVLAENIYALCDNSFHIPYLKFMCWSLIHAGWMHWLLATFNAHEWTMGYVTSFCSEIFSLLNSLIYFHKAIQELQRAHDNLSFAAFLYAIIGAVGTFLVALFLSTAELWKPLFHKYMRIGLREYAAAISIIIFIGLPHIGELENLDKGYLPVSRTFTPSDPARTEFFVRFWELPLAWIFGAIIPGLIITVLFYFDHEISSIICTVDRYGTKKPGGFSWDIMLLGATTIMCGILGIPPANGLLPQAPLHSESLLHSEVEETVRVSDGEEKQEVKVTERVYEQRWSHFLHAGGIICFVSPPLMHVLGLTPTSVLAGLFIFMGEQSLSVNPVLYRFFQMMTPPSELPALPPAVKGYLGVHMYTATQIVVTVGIFIVTLTIAGPAFPIIVIACVPARLWIMNRLWDRETLRYVDSWACRDGCPEDDEDRRKAERDNASPEQTPEFLHEEPKDV